MMQMSVGRRPVCARATLLERRARARRWRGAHGRRHVCARSALDGRSSGVCAWRPKSARKRAQNLRAGGKRDPARCQIHRIPCVMRLLLTNGESFEPGWWRAGVLPPRTSTVGCASSTFESRPPARWGSTQPLHTRWRPPARRCRPRWGRIAQDWASLVHLQPKLASLCRSPPRNCRRSHPKIGESRRSEIVSNQDLLRKCLATLDELTRFSHFLKLAKLSPGVIIRIARGRNDSKGVTFSVPESSICMGRAKLNTTTARLRNLWRLATSRSPPQPPRRPEVSRGPFLVPFGAYFREQCVVADFCSLCSLALCCGCAPPVEPSVCADGLLSSLGVRMSPGALLLMLRVFLARRLRRFYSRGMLRPRSARKCRLPPLEPVAGVLRQGQALTHAGVFRRSRLGVVPIWRRSRAALARRSDAARAPLGAPGLGLEHTLWNEPHRVDRCSATHLASVEQVQAVFSSCAARFLTLRSL